MFEIDPLTDATDLSVNFIIELIRDFRNSLISKLLKDEHLIPFVNRQYQTNLTPVKMAFLKKELQELSHTSLDLVHYSKMIREMKDFVSIKSDALFYQELEPIFEKYCT